MKQLFLLAISFICLISCKTPYSALPHQEKLNEIPPNGVKIGENLFIDETEISNFNWLEYAYWRSVIFTDSSEVDHLTSLDHHQWIEIINDTAYTDYYLGHPAYRDYPVVNVTYEQTKQFAKWRSDRVYEQLLIREGLLHHNPNQTSSNYFSIEKYLKGEYCNIQPPEVLPYYPIFDIPTLEHYQLALQYNDTLIEKKHGRFKLVLLRNLNLKGIPLHIKGDEVVNLIAVDYTTPVRSPKDLYEIDNHIAYLKGNVSEFTRDSTIVFGGNWYHPRAHHPVTGTFKHSGSAPYIGFRNVCHWVPIPELKKELGIE